MTENPQPFGTPGTPPTPSGDNAPGSSPVSGTPYCPYPPSPAGTPGYYGVYPGSYPPPPMPYAGYPGDVPVAPRNGMGIAALVAAIIGVVTSFTVIGGVLLGLTAVVVGVLARGRVKRGEADNGAVAMAGVIVGAAALVLGIAFAALWIGMFQKLGAADYFDCVERAGRDQNQIDQCIEDFRQSVESRISTDSTHPPR